MTSGSYAIITGGSSGIGKATALELASRGISVTLACRNRESGENAAAEIASASGNASVRSMRCDLASLQSVRDFAAEYKRSGAPLNILVNNAGVMACPLMYTEDGFEQHFGVNHLGHFLLTKLLLDTLVSSAASGSSRVVVFASAAERIGSIDLDDLHFKNSRAYNRWLAYAHSKLANCLFSFELSRRCSEWNLPVTSNCLHPGIVDTQLIRHVLPQAVSASENKFRHFLRKLLRLRSPKEGAATAVYLAASTELEAVSGKYFEDCQVSRPSSKATDTALAKALWQASDEATGDHRWVSGQPV